MKYKYLTIAVFAWILITLLIVAVVNASPDCPSGTDCRTATSTPTRTGTATPTVIPTAWATLSAAPTMPVTPTIANPTQSATESPPTVHPPNGNAIYLPLIRQPQIRLGVQLEQLNTEWVIPGGTIYYALRWHDVEAGRGIYVWPDLNAFAGYKLVLGIKTSPAWALEPGRKICAAPKSEYYPDLARFVLTAVEQYQPAAVSLWNEPDVPELLANYPEQYGCIDDPAVYSDMVIAVYDALAGRVPLIAGEFAMIELPSSYVANFITRTAGHYDVLSFHYHAWMPETVGVEQRIEFIRRYYAGPLWLSETSMVCEVDCGAEFETMQEEYLRLVYSTPLDYILWYTGAPNGWRNSDLIRLDGTPRPAWYTYRMLTGR